MIITRIHLTNRAGDRFATVTRLPGSPMITIEVLTQDIPNGRIHHVQPDCEEDIWSMAECLQETLDGVRGTNSMIHDYFRELQRFAD